MGGKEVTYNGSVYKAKWWTQGEKPDSSAVWVLVKANGNVAPNASANEWSASKVYLSGDKVKYTNVLYQANWWTQGNDPVTSREWSIVNSIAYLCSIGCNIQWGIGFFILNW